MVEDGMLYKEARKIVSLISFNKNWTHYEKGFRDLNTEFWYGLEEINCLTLRGQWQMRLDYQKNDKTCMVLPAI